MKKFKQGLLNAGFKEHRKEDIFIKRVGETYVSIHKGGPIVYIAKKGFQVLEPTKFLDLAELKKICYGYIFEDLNFEAKKYSWEECFKRDKGYYVDRDSTIEEVKAMVSINIEDKQNVVPTELNALSIQATTQLMQICAEINKDFTKDTSMFKYYPILTVENEIAHICRDAKVNPFCMNSEKAIEMLIKTNTPLLLQYFEKIEQ